MPGYIWSTEEKEALRKLAEAGYTASEIHASKVFERTLNGILSQGVMMGLSFSRKGEIDKEAFTKMMEARNGGNGR